MPTAAAETAQHPRPDAPAPLLDATAWAFAGLSRLRHRRRSLHPPGIAFRARTEIAPAGVPLGAALFDEPGVFDGVVRFSRGIGLPQPLPDLCGIAVRLRDAHGPGRPQDLLMTTSSARPVLQHLLLPARRGFFGQGLSTVLPFRIGGRSRVIGLLPATVPVAAEGTDLEQAAATAARGDLRYALCVSDAPLGRWRRVGAVHVGAPLPADEAEALTFDPWVTSDEVRPAGWLFALRAGAYPGSQRGRDAG